MSTSSIEPIATDFGPSRPPITEIAGSFVAAAIGVALGFWLTPAFPHESGRPGSRVDQAVLEASAQPAAGGEPGLSMNDHDPLGMPPRDPR